MKVQKQKARNHLRTRTLVLAMAIVGVLISVPTQAQLGADCTASLLGRTAQVNDDGSFFIANIPVEPGLHRVRVTCSPDGGVIARGQSPLFDIQPNFLIIVGPIAFGTVDPIPVFLQVTAPTTTLDQAGQQVQLNVQGVLADGSSVDMTAASGGTVYVSSDERVAKVDSMGKVTAYERGAVVITVRREGVVGSIRIDVAIPNDADGDGMTDDFEVANDLDPNNPTDALEDLDGDGLTNLEEFQYGTSIVAADTDGDGLTDRDEISRGTPPADPDADDDGLLDGFEVARGLNALAADTDNDTILDGVEVAIGTDPLVPNATTTLTGQVRGESGAAVEGAAAVALGRIVASTGQSGRFTLSGVPADVGAITVYSRPIREGKVLDGSSAAVTPVAGGSTDVGVISLAQVSGVVSGTVRDPQGEPVPDAGERLHGTHHLLPCRWILSGQDKLPVPSDRRAEWKCLRSFDPPQSDRAAVSWPRFRYVLEPGIPGTAAGVTHADPRHQFINWSRAGCQV